MVQEVLQAVQAAFGTEEVVNRLLTRQGRVFGSVEVRHSPVFDGLDDIRRQRLLRQELRRILGAEAAQVGPIVLEPRNLV